MYGAMEQLQKISADFQQELILSPSLTLMDVASLRHPL
jgi:hypothetical protein